MKAETNARLVDLQLQINKLNDRIDDADRGADMLTQDRDEHLRRIHNVEKYSDHLMEEIKVRDRRHYEAVSAAATHRSELADRVKYLESAVEDIGTILTKRLDMHSERFANLERHSERSKDRLTALEAGEISVEVSPGWEGEPGYPSYEPGRIYTIAPDDVPAGSMDVFPDTCEHQFAELFSRVQALEKFTQIELSDEAMGDPDRPLDWNDLREPAPTKEQFNQGLESLIRERATFQANGNPRHPEWMIDEPKNDYAGYTYPGLAPSAKTSQTYLVIEDDQVTGRIDVVSEYPAIAAQAVLADRVSRGVHEEDAILVIQVGE